MKSCRDKNILTRQQKGSTQF